MTPKELSDLIHKLEPDRLLTRAAVGFWLRGNEVKDVDACLAYCEAHGLLCKVQSKAGEKWFRDGEIVEVKPVVQPVAEVPVLTQKPVRRKAPPTIEVQPSLFVR